MLPKPYLSYLKKWETNGGKLFSYSFFDKKTSFTTYDSLFPKLDIMNAARKFEHAFSDLMENAGKSADNAGIRNDVLSYTVKIEKYTNDMVSKTNRECYRVTGPIGMQKVRNENELLAGFLSSIYEKGVFGVPRYEREKFFGLIMDKYLFLTGFHEAVRNLYNSPEKEQPSNNDLDCVFIKNFYLNATNCYQSYTIDGKFQRMIYPAEGLNLFVTESPDLDLITGDQPMINYAKDPLNDVEWFYPIGPHKAIMITRTEAPEKLTAEKADHFNQKIANACLQKIIAEKEETLMKYAR